MSRLPRTLRVSREISLGSHQTQNSGLYTHGAPNAPRDVSDAMAGHHAIDQSTVATAVASIAAAAANSHKRRG